MQWSFLQTIPGGITFAEGLPSCPTLHKTGSCLGRAVNGSKFCASLENFIIQISHDARPSVLSLVAIAMMPEAYLFSSSDTTVMGRTLGGALA